MIGRNPAHALLVVTVSLIGLAAASALGANAAAQGPTTIGIDAYPSGNTATELAEIESCVSVNTDDTLDVDIFIQEAEDLLAWEAYLSYDPAVLQVVDRDLQMFQAANAGSSAFDSSEDVPDDDGIYRVGAADISDPPALDTGSGVLARITLKAMGEGISDLSLFPIDVDEDGTPDVGPTLKDGANQSVQDDDGDGFFDGPMEDAQVAVGVDCPPGSNPFVDARNSGDGGGGVAWWAVAVGVAVGAVILGGGAVVYSRLRLRRVGDSV